MIDISTTKLVVPAAGFGKRLGSPKAKELLQLKEEEGPLIEWCLRLAHQYHLPIVVISRKEKRELNNYLETMASRYHLEICYIESSQEWPDSILQSETFWSDQNIVILPDTRFSPVEIILQMAQVLQQNPYAFATFSPPALQTWGVLRQQKEGFYISEKPSLSEPKDLAWGLFGFQKHTGVALLQAMLQSKGDFQFVSNTEVQTFTLESFEDKSRNGLSHFEKSE